MLNRIIEFSIRNKLIPALLVVALIGYGTVELLRLPIDAVPDITDNQVQVITVTPSLGAPDVERLITFPVEQGCSNIPGLHEIRSFSRFGLSVVTIVFNDKIDVYWARQQVAERLQEVQNEIPAGVGVPSLAPVTTGLGEIYQYVIRPLPGYENKYSPMELRTMQDWIVRRQLRDVKGVADVSSFGGYLKQYEIAVNTDRLRSYGITINDVFRAVEANNDNTGGAYIEKGPRALFIRTEGLVGSINDIGQIPVKMLSSGVPVHIRDVAEVRLGHATRYGAMSYNGDEEVAGAVVMMLKGANSNEVIKNVKERIARISKTLPEGVVIEPFLDRTKMVDNAIGTIEKNLMEGALIVLFVLVLFLGNVRAGLLVASVIPLSMLFAVILMNAFGVSGNLMSLGAIDFGLIVDGTVIIVEAVLHQMHKRGMGTPGRDEMNKLVYDSSHRMLNAAVFGEAIILLVYIPIFSLQGIEGKMFRPMALTVAFALMGAFILSLTYVPAMSSLTLRKAGKENSFSDRFVAMLQRIYEPALGRILQYPRLTLIASLLLVVAGGVVGASLGGEFIPKLEEGDFAVETRVLPGSSIATSQKAIADGARILRAKFPEVIKVVGKTGSSEIPTDPMPIDASDMIIVLKDKKEWTSATTFDELAEKMGKELEAVAGVTFGFQYPVQMRFNELMTGARQDVVCKIFGENLDTLARYAKQLGAIANTVDGTADIYVEPVGGVPQIVVTYDRERLAFYGLDIAEVNRVINTAFAGQRTGRVYEGERRFDLVVRLAGKMRKNIDDVGNLLITTPMGIQIPVRQIADVRLTESANQIQRENAKRRIVVGFNVRGRDVESIIKELQGKAGKTLGLPVGYYVTYGGSFENLQQAKQRLGIAVPVSLALIFLMLYFAFRSLRQGLLIYSAIPLSAVGGVIALAARGMPFSISAGVGFIALFGVAVLNGIVLISEFNRLRKEGMADLTEIVKLGTRSRLRPVLMTASVASLGFLPMALSHGAGAEVQRPLATVVIGGLLTATFLTLFVLPVLYTLFSGKTKGSPTATVASLLLAVLLPLMSDAQKPTSLETALDIAIKNNLTLKKEQLVADYREALTKAGWTLPQTQVNGEYGHVNSYYNDSKIGVSQGFSFPTVYSRQKALNVSEWEAARIQVSVQETELRKQVTQAYYDMAWLMKKITLLEEADTLFTTFLDKAKLRFEKGAANILEQATAETQRGHVEQQLQLALQDLQLAGIRFRYLLNTTTHIRPDTTSLLAKVQLADPATLDAHPRLRYLKQMQQVSDDEYRLQKAKFLPEFSAGYNNQSFTGWQQVGNKDEYFNITNRFSTVQAGIALPLFGGAQHAKTQAARVNRQFAQNNYELAVFDMHSQYASLNTQYNTHRRILDYYEQTALKNAGLIINAASQQYNAGDIDYLQYTTMLNQAIAIKSEYLDAIRELNKVITELNNLSYR